MKILYFIPKDYFNSKETIPYKFINGLEKTITYSVAETPLQYLKFRLKKTSYDFVHIYGANKKFIKIESYLARILKTKYIFHVMSKSDVMVLEELPSHIINRIEALIFNDADLIKELDIDKKIPKYTIFEGANIEHYYPQVLKQLSLKKEIVSYCDFTSDCKMHLLVEAARYLPAQYFLTFIGHNYDPEYFEQLKDMAENLGVKLKVDFVTDFDEVYIREKFADANVFITVSNKFSSQVNAYKALLLGTVAVCPTKEYDINGLFRLESFAPRVIAKQIKDLADSDELVDVVFAKKILSWQTKVRELIEVYNEVLKYP